MLAMKTAAEGRQTDDEGLCMMAPTLAQYLVCTTVTTILPHCTIYTYSHISAFFWVSWVFRIPTFGNFYKL